MRPHLPTLLGIAAGVWPLAVLIHEGGGHGLACVAVGGVIEGVSLARCACAHSGAIEAIRVVKAAGTGANLVAAAGALLVAPRIPDPHGRYAVSLFGAVSAWMGFGYLLVDPLAGFGDWTGFLRGLPSGLRFVLSGLGLVGFSATIRWWLRVGLAPFLPEDAQERKAVARALAVPAWLVVGGALMTAVTLLDRGGAKFAVTSALATLGGTSPLAWCWTMADRAPGSPHPARLDRRPGAMALGAAVFALLALGFARGLPS